MLYGRRTHLKLFKKDRASCIYFSCHSPQTFCGSFSCVAPQNSVNYYSKLWVRFPPSLSPPYTRDVAALHCFHARKSTKQRLLETFTDAASSASKPEERQTQTTLEADTAGNRGRLSKGGDLAGNERDRLSAACKLLGLSEGFELDGTWGVLAEPVLCTDVALWCYFLFITTLYYNS